MSAAPDEFDWIAALRPLTRGAPAALGLMDDAAVLPARPGFDLVISEDAMVEGVHFLEGEDAQVVARRLLRTSLSDLAAKAAEPFGYTLMIAWPASRGWDERMAFIRGLDQDGARYGVALLGGDTVSTPGPLMISITAFGRVPVGRMVRRSGAKPGDLVVVTGTIGDAALGLDVLKHGAVAAALADDAAARDLLVGRYRVPQPRTALASAVRDHAQAAMDVSDGLAGDLTKLCRASGVSATIDVVRIPLSGVAASLVASGTVGIEAIVSGGDDYEVLCAIPQNHFETFARAAGLAGIAVTAIGTVTAGKSVPRFLDAEGREIALQRLSYSHF